MKIAIASSGLGHVQRGIEAWAAATAEALAQLIVAGHQCPVSGGQLEVMLFCGGEIKDAGYRMQGSSLPDAVSANHPSGIRIKHLPCLKRGTRLARFLSKATPGFSWRWGWKSPYGIEQFTFALAMIRELKKSPVDIVHTQDVIVAQLLERARKKGVITAKIILAHGTEEEMDALAQFDYLQELSPAYAERWRGAEDGGRKEKDEGGNLKPEKERRQETEGGKEKDEGGNLKPEKERRQETEGGKEKDEGGRLDLPKVFMVPNFVDTDIFSPENLESPRSQHALREKYGIPKESFVIGSVGAVQKTHKRIDFLIREFAEICRHGQQNSDCCFSNRDLFLLIVGARTAESEELIRMVEELAPSRAKILFDIPHSAMPELYNCMDLYVHPAAEEIFGICLLEAMASGVPVIAHKYPVTEWILGRAEDEVQDIGCGLCIDMKAEGCLRELVQNLVADTCQLAQMGKRARMRAEEMFSSEAVIPQFVEMYRAVNGKQ